LTRDAHAACETEEQHDRERADLHWLACEHVEADRADHHEDRYHHRRIPRVERSPAAVRHDETEINVPKAIALCHRAIGWVRRSRST
jgi:hypothetical protein